MQVAQFLRSFGLPLLAKELIEQAARRRTYIIRVTYAVVLCAASYLIFYETMYAASVSPLSALGQGRQIFVGLVSLQFAGVYLFMPAMTCGVITQEKERSSLQLLFLTRLGPWAILFEKLLGRIVPMLAFLLLALPLSAFAYTLGGISSSQLWSGVWLLVLATIHMGSLALACSAFCRTTVGAFMASYVIAFLMFFGPYIVWIFLYLATLALGIDLEGRFASLNSSPVYIVIFAFPFFSPAMLMLSTAFPTGMGWWPMAIHSTIILSTSAACLGLARYFILRRAFVPRRNLLLELVKSFDRSDRRASDRDDGAGLVSPPVLRDESVLPDKDPVAWRETAKRALGQRRYLFRLLLLIEIPLLIVCGLMSLSEHYSVGVGMTMMSLMAWALAVLIVSVQSASLIASERSQQTLDVLCTTPLSSRDIVLQKLRGVWRMMLVLFVPLMTLVLFDSWSYARSDISQPWGRASPLEPLLYILCSVTTAAVYLPLIAWMSLTIGLFVRSQARAMIGSLGVIVAWSVAPLVFIVIPLSVMSTGIAGPREFVSFFTLLSPATIVFMNEFKSLQDFPGGSITAIIVNSLAYSFVLLGIRSVCLANADRWLGRATDST